MKYGNMRAEFPPSRERRGKKRERWEKTRERRKGMQEQLRKTRQKLAKHSCGFTLIEVLIAMLIIAIAFTAILKATENSLAATSRLQSRVVAHWVAEEILASAQTGSLKLPVDNRALPGETLMLGQTYQWLITPQTTTRKNITELRISVTQHDQTLYTLTGPYLKPQLPAGSIIN